MRLRSLIGNSLGFIGVIWAIPVAIIVVGMPIAMLFMGLRMIVRLIWPV